MRVSSARVWIRTRFATSFNQALAELPMHREKRSSNVRASCWRVFDPRKRAVFVASSLSRLATSIGTFVEMKDARHLHSESMSSSLALIWMHRSCCVGGLPTASASIIAEAAMAVLTSPQQVEKLTAASFPISTRIMSAASRTSCVLQHGSSVICRNTFHSRQLFMLRKMSSLRRTISCS